MSPSPSPWNIPPVLLGTTLGGATPSGVRRADPLGLGERRSAVGGLRPGLAATRRGYPANDLDSILDMDAAERPVGSKRFGRAPAAHHQRLAAMLLPQLDVPDAVHRTRLRDEPPRHAQRCAPRPRTPGLARGGAGRRARRRGRSFPRAPARSGGVPGRFEASAGLPAASASAWRWPTC